MPASNIRGGKGGRKTSRRKRDIKNSAGEIDPESGNGYYAEVIKIAGGNYIDVKLDNGTKDKARIPGRLYNRMGRFRAGDFIRIDSDKEILGKVLPTDKDANIARIRLGKIDAKDNMGITFGDDNVSSEDENGDDEFLEIMESKKEKVLKHKLNEKNRDLERRTTRNTNMVATNSSGITDVVREEPEESENSEESSDEEELSVNKKSISSKPISKKDESSDSEEINFDDL